MKQDIPTTGFTGDDALRYLWMWSIIAGLFFFPSFMSHYLPAGGGFDVKGVPLGHDFSNIWTGAKLLIAGKTSYLPPRDRFMQAMAEYFHYTPIYHSFSYPPNNYIFIIGFGLFSYFTALALWTVIGMTAFSAGLRISKWSSWRPQHFALLFLSPASIITFCSSNNGFFTGSLFLLGVLLCETQPVLAGVFIGLLTVKPHLGLIFIPLLLLRRNVKCFASATFTSIFMLGLSMVVWGVQPWLDYINITMPEQMLWLTSYFGDFCSMMPSIYTNALMGDVEPTKAYKMLWAAAHVIFALWATVTALYAANKDGITPRTVLMLAIAGLMIPPYCFGYDMTAITGGIMIYLGSRKNVSLPCFFFAGLLWTVPLVIMPLKVNMLPFASFCMPAMLFYLARTPLEGKGEAAVTVPVTAVSA